MRSTSFILAAGAALTFSVPAIAAANRTFVSGKGIDSGACTLAAPCRSFAYAVLQTVPGGEIDVLDTAGYGPMTITQAVSIVNEGSVASIQAASGDAITVSAGTSDKVFLKGLTVEGLGTGTNGIVLNSAGSLDIANCTIRHFAQDGVRLVPTTYSSVSVTDSTISDNNTNGFNSSATNIALYSTIWNSVFRNNSYNAVVAANGAKIDIAHSSFWSNSHGVTTSGSSMAQLRDVVISGNGDGILLYDTSSVRIAHSTITHNSIGIFISRGTAYSYGDNNINDNNTDVCGYVQSPALTPVAQR